MKTDGTKETPSSPPRTLIEIPKRKHKSRNRRYPFRNFPVPKRPYETGDIWTLTDKEFRLYHYLTWKTWGFEKTEDAISLSQMKDGIRDRHGRITQAGTGYSLRTLSRLLKGLADKGWITRRRNGSRPTIYSILNPLLFDNFPSEAHAVLSRQEGCGTK